MTEVNVIHGDCTDRDIWEPTPVETWPAAANHEFRDEQLGTKRKFWVPDPGGEHDWLFKFARRDRRDGVISGEDWAECLVHMLSRLIGIPTAHVRTATYKGARGIISKNLAPPPYRLEHGDELIAAVCPDYDPSSIRDNRHHTVDTVQQSLKSIGPAREVRDVPITGGFDLWAGFVLMDAWISGTDRHPQNWGSISLGGSRLIAPSFDHGNALGFQLRDAERQRCLEDPQALRRWAGRGTNNYFSGKPKLLDLARGALSKVNTDVRRYWRTCFIELDMDQVKDEVSRVPHGLLSEVGRSFVIQLLTVNRERIVNACAQFA